ncbi:hypothetical protein KAJ27_05120 [bacterium]|nr:hypothetical protein [bacterium]
MKKISICEIEYPNGSGNMRRNSAHGFVKSGRPIIDTDQGRRLQQFIDESWVTFRKLKQSRKLFNAALLLTICR